MAGTFRSGLDAMTIETPRMSNSSHARGVPQGSWMQSPSTTLRFSPANRYPN